MGWLRDMTWLDEDERHSAPLLPTCMRHSFSVTVPLRIAPLHLEKAWEPMEAGHVSVFITPHPGL